MFGSHVRVRTESDVGKNSGIWQLAKMEKKGNTVGEFGRLQVDEKATPMDHARDQRQTELINCRYVGCFAHMQVFKDKWQARVGLQWTSTGKQKFGIQEVGRCFGT